MAALSDANRLGLDYEREAESFAAPAGGIIDMHTHLTGREAVAIYEKAAALYGIESVFSMTPLEELETVKAVLGDAVQFIAMHDLNENDRVYATGRGYIDRIRKYHAAGTRLVKFFCAPRLYEFSPRNFANSPLRLDSPGRQEAMSAAADLGMAFMVHVADPDTWFKTRYADAERYGTKQQQYEMLESVLERFRLPVIGAHLGGSPEDLDFLSGLLERHPNFYLDSSAAKWMIRELSRQPLDKARQFFHRWRGRIFFGTDLITTDQHLNSGNKSNPKAQQASSAAEALELYASRFWAMRKLFESDYRGESPIADPDLHLVEPQKYTEMDAPLLRGLGLREEALSELYSGAARRFLRDLPAQ